MTRKRYEMTRRVQSHSPRRQPPVSNQRRRQEPGPARSDTRSSTQRSSHRPRRHEQPVAEPNGTPAAAGAQGMAADAGPAATRTTRDNRAGGQQAGRAGGPPQPEAPRSQSAAVGRAPPRERGQGRRYLRNLTRQLIGDAQFGESEQVRFERSGRSAREARGEEVRIERRTRTTGGRGTGQHTEEIRIERRTRTTHRGWPLGETEEVHVEYRFHEAHGGAYLNTDTETESEIEQVPIEPRPRRARRNRRAAATLDAAPGQSDDETADVTEARLFERSRDEYIASVEINVSFNMPESIHAMRTVVEHIIRRPRPAAGLLPDDVTLCMGRGPDAAAAITLAEALPTLCTRRGWSCGLKLFEESHMTLNPQRGRQRVLKRVFDACVALCDTQEPRALALAMRARVPALVRHIDEDTRPEAGPERALLDEIFYAVREVKGTTMSTVLRQAVKDLLDDDALAPRSRWTTENFGDNVPLDRVPRG